MMNDYQPPQSASELLDRYRRGERYFGHSELGVTVCDFRGVVLSEADFIRSFIAADFRAADLRSVNFASCNLKTCDFRGADFRDAIFCAACLEGTQFAEATLDGADFEGASVFSYQMKARETPDW